MSYYLGQNTDTVKPITRRTTWTRPVFNMQRRQGYLMKRGRCPINRHGYPVAGGPVAAEKAFGLQLRRMPPPGQAFGWHKKMDMARLRALSTPVMQNKLRAQWTKPTLGYVTDVDLSLEPGQQLGGLMDVFKVPTLTSSFAPTVAAPAPASSSFWDPFASVVQLWNERPQVLKDIRINVDPNRVMQAAQSVVKPGQLQNFVNQASQWGVNLDYRGMPISGQTAGFGYRLAGIDWAGWMPWIIGGGVALVALPMLMGKR